MKGQEEAPIELLIGVTVLTFVLIIAYYVYENVSSTQYLERVKASTSQFARVIENVAQGGPGTTQHISLDFSGSSGDTRISQITIAKGPPDACLNALGTRDCYMIYVIANVSGTMQIVHSELLYHVSGEDIWYDPTGANMNCDYTGLLTYFSNPSSGDACGAENFLNAGVYHFTVSKTPDDKILISTGG